MKYTGRLGILAIATLALLPFSLGAQTPAQIDALFAVYDQPGSLGCALGVVQNGEFVYRRGYGSATLDWELPINPETTFYVGSVSKQFSAAAVVLLSLEGKLSLDDDIRRFLPEMPEYPRSVTIRHLVHHTSGVPDMYRVMEENGLTTRNLFTPEEALELLSRQPLDFQPGDQYRYSNGGYFLLSMIVRRASGKSLREYAQEKIFGPLGMTGTHFHDDPVHIVPRRAMSYRRAEGGGFYQSYEGNFALPGAGGLYTTVNDFIAWDRNFYRRTVGGDAMQEIMHTRAVLNDGRVLDYAFGVEHGQHRGLPTVAHSGSYMGFKAYYVRFPEQRFSVFTFCNMDEIEPGRLSYAVADLYLADQMTPRESR